MMAFITHFFKRLKHYAFISGIFGMLIYATSAHASSNIQAEFIEARYTDEVMLVNARYKILLNATLEDALNNGVSLPFLYEIEITRPRWYALYRDMFGESLQRSYRLSFHALTRQYRLSQGSYYRGFNSLNEALSALGILRNWRMLEGYISAKNYQNVGARIRMRLDVSQLPRPYQIITLGNTQWSLESSWNEFQPQLDEMSAKEVKV
jgi:hypothetical protein